MSCSAEAKVVLGCLVVNVVIVTRAVLLSIPAPAGFEEIQLLLLIIPAALGFVLSLKCRHKHTFLDKLVGVTGLTWFGLLFVWVLFVSVW